MDIRKVKKLIEMMEESDISEIEIKEGEESVRISRGSRTIMPSVIKSTVVPATEVEADLSSSGHVSTRGYIVVAPMVGIFYRAPSPESPPFFEIGDRVKEGDTLCIIESMKMMNQIKTERAGQIEAILVGNDEPVEFDQPLFTIV